VNEGYDKTSLLTGPRKDHKGQTTGINISILAARSGLPLEIFLAFNIVVCIVAGFYAVLFSALKRLLLTKVI